MSSGLFHKIERFVLKKLEGLSPDLTYHSAGHTRDVLRQSIRIAEEESVMDERELFILKLAALYHDTGFLETYSNHEERSCDIFIRDAAEFKLNPVDCEQIKELIMVTKIPQQPKNLLESIICDADLDYLGRDDFPIIGNKLKQEFMVYGVVRNEDEWEQLQLKFLSSHHYHTPSARRDREPIKQQHLESLLK